jgi:hypothetical protein
MNEEKDIQELENDFSAFDGKQSFRLPEDYMNQLKNQVKSETKKEKAFSLKRMVLPLLATACILTFVLNLNLNTVEATGDDFEITLADMDLEDLSDEDLSQFVEEDELGDSENLELYLMDEIDDITLIEEELLKCIKC